MPESTILQAMIGNWEGTCRTWFEPNKLADTSSIRGEFTPVLEEKFLRHVYSAQIQGKPREGEELIARNGVTELYQVTWIDSFHMNYAIQLSLGPATTNGFSVQGSYDVGGGHPPWGWRTEYKLPSNNELQMTAYNISPQGEEAKAIETLYVRRS